MSVSFNNYQECSRGTKVLSRPGIALLLLGLVFAPVIAQDECTAILAKAQKQYEAGTIEQIPQLLSSCLQNGFTASEKIQARKLTILSYLFNNNPVEAEKGMLEFLKLNPEYTINSSDQAEFVHLFNEFSTIPVASIGFQAGIYIPTVSVIRRYGVYNLNSQKGVYSSIPGFRAGVTFSHYVRPRMDIDIEALYGQYSFGYAQDNMSNFTSLSVTENHKRIDLPVTMKYTFPTPGKIIPYLRAGASFSYLLQSTQLMDRGFSDNTVKSITAPDQDISERRTKYLVFAVAGGGIKYRIPRGYIFLDARMDIGVMNIVNTSKRYSVIDNEFNYFYTDNDFRINGFQFSVGYVYSFYKSEKKK